MAFSLIDKTPDAVPITLVAKERFAQWCAEACESERNWLAATGFAAEPGACALVPDENGRVGRVVVGLGGEREPGAALWALAGLPDALPDGNYRLATVPAGLDQSHLALGWALATYAFDRYHARKRKATALIWPEGADRGRVLALARAVFLVRDLANTPAGDLGPCELADKAAEVAGRTGADYRVIVGDELLAENYPTIHTVGRASTRAPRLVDIRWGDPAAPRVTLVGKGVCFDTGGLDLKTASGMRLMKKDMAGAAIVLGLGQAIIETGLALRLRVLLPLVENAVSGNAMRPLDIVRTRKGLTVEIGNTDAEGRLILCDALAEAATEKPALLVDVATLTGAARVAVGPELGALFSNDDGLAAALVEAGMAEDDPLWRLPLWRPYRRMIDSKVADLNNVAESPYAGAVVAALYLQEFVEPGIPWAHLDVMAWNQRNRPGRPEGAEATGLRALYAHIERRFG
ncbi:MAG TPA: leucyl aminopeptidase family protein [Stellaceae bacterium]|nr:leucyl aminopeptidase family protein [Stellaceae bacterium]